jgi:hypothetical protein
MISPHRQKVNRRGENKPKPDKPEPNRRSKTFFTGMKRIYRIKSKKFFRVNQKSLILFIFSIPVNFVFEGFSVTNFAQ